MWDKLIQSRTHPREFLGYMLIYCPDFPKEDYLEPDQQMDLGLAFEMLRGGLKYVNNRLGTGGVEGAQRRLREAEQHFRNGQIPEGVAILHELRVQWFGSRSKRT